MLLLVMTYSTYEWSQIITRTTVSTTRGSIEIMEKKSKCLKIGNMTLVILYFVLFMVYIPLPKEVVYHYINFVIATMFIIQALLLRHYSLQIYHITGRSAFLYSRLTCLWILLLLRSVHIIV